MRIGAGLSSLLGGGKGVREGREGVREGGGASDKGGRGVTEGREGVREEGMSVEMQQRREGHEKEEQGWREREGRA